MAWNLLERIINAFKPSEEREQPSDEPQPWLEEDSVEQQPCEEPSSEFEQMAGVAPKQEDWQE
jgi:hypothetical protein